MFSTKIPEPPPKPEKRDRREGRERHLIYLSSSDSGEEETGNVALTPIVSPYGQYPCCKQAAYVFSPLPVLNVSKKCCSYWIVNYHLQLVFAMYA